MTAPRISRYLAAGWCVLGLGVVAAPSTRGAEPTPKPTILVRAVHPEREVAALLALFRGSRADHPAAALAAWKRASREPKRLGKTWDAAIALLNPRMLPEFRLLDGAQAAISFAPGSDRPGWWVRFPNDDGTLGALGPTAVLSGGQLDPPLGAVEVDRFPGVDSPLVAQGPSGFVMVGSRDQLALALAPSEFPAPDATVVSGWLVEVDPSASATWTSPGGLRWAEAARSTRCSAVQGSVRIVEGTLVSRWVGRFGSNPPTLAPVEPTWLDSIPACGPLAAFACRVDPRPESWDSIFGLLARLEPPDPARPVTVAPRARLALAARVLGIPLEAEIWPHLVGLAGWVGTTAGTINRALVAIHLDDEPAARRLMGGIKGARRDDGPDEVVDVVLIASIRLRLVRRGASVFVAWGDRAWEDARATLEHPERSARRWLDSTRSGRRPTRVGAIWTDQLPRVPPGTPLAESLAAAPPIRWAGWNEADQTIDEVWMDDLDATIRRFLDRLPLDPPPSH